MTLRPGEHLLIVGGHETGLWGRGQGYEIRDSAVVFLSGPRVLVVWLFRIPFDGTVVSQVLTTQTGAMNIDASRVEGAPRDPGFVAPTKRSDNWGMQRPGLIGRDTPTGRWPSNLVLVHGEGCERTGTRSIQAQGGDVAVVRQSEGYQGPSLGRDSRKEGNVRPSYREGGQETAAVWECDLGCPVRLLDGISGELHSSYRSAERALAKTEEQKVCGGEHNTYGKGLDTKPVGKLYIDSGTASRFYPQFQSFTDCLTWFETLVAS